MDKREKFTSKLGFVMACIGSAIGLGNIWMFPYRLGAYGGAAFLIPYFIFVFILGTTGLITEFAFGRHFSGGSMTGIMTVFKEKKRRENCRDASGDRSAWNLYVLQYCCGMDSKIFCFKRNWEIKDNR